MDSLQEHWTNFGPSIMRSLTVYPTTKFVILGQSWSPKPTSLTAEENHSRTFSAIELRGCIYLTTIHSTVGYLGEWMLLWWDSKGSQVHVLENRDASLVFCLVTVIPQFEVFPCLTILHVLNYLVKWFNIFTNFLTIILPSGYLLLHFPSANQFFVSSLRQLQWVWLNELLFS